MRAGAPRPPSSRPLPAPTPTAPNSPPCPAHGPNSLRGACPHRAPCNRTAPDSLLGPSARPLQAPTPTAPNSPPCPASGGALQTPPLGLVLEPGSLACREWRRVATGVSNVASWPVPVACAVLSSASALRDRPRVCARVCVRTRPVGLALRFCAPCPTVLAGSPSAGVLARAGGGWTPSHLCRCGCCWCVGCVCRVVTSDGFGWELVR